MLATSREARFAFGKAAPLGVLPAEAARKLAIDGAVEMAARAVGTMVPSWVAYEERLGAEIGRLLGDKALLGDYPRGVFAALDLSIERCPSGTPARRRLESAAVFAPEAVPLSWATEIAGLDAEDGAAIKALKELGQFGLVAVDEAAEALSMHRLVRLRIREQADKGTWRQVSGRRLAWPIGCK